RYPAWRATLIFRWRLLYFVGYVGGAILLSQCLKGLNESLMFGAALREKVLGGKVVAERIVEDNRAFSSERVQYIFQRTATLLAVAALTLCSIAAFTGVLIAFYYQPVAMGAHESLAAIEQTVANGTLILSLHEVAGNGLIGLALVQIVVMFLGRDFSRAWLTGWLSGIFLTLAAIGLSWSAIVLNWGQTSFWRFKVELSIVASIPWVGPTLRDVLSGGGGISSLTLQHMYTLHSYMLAIAAVVLSLVHLSALVMQEQRWKPLASRLSLAQLCKEMATEGE
ncbi:MAG: cytochrome b N-terminal domain-containing protein, partial [Cyanobacteria bacterium P01_F01_bin.53]